MQSNGSENLWGIEIDPTKVETPKQILEQQGHWLEKITNGALIAYVDTTTYSDDRLCHEFIIHSPALDYRYILFDVTHPILMYPLRVRSPVFKVREKKCENQEHFKEVLAEILSHNSTKRIVNSLIAQSG